MSRFTDFAGNLIEKTAGRIVRNAEALSQQEAAEAEQERMRNLKEKFAEFASNPKFLEFLKTDPTFDQALLEREQTDDVIEEIMEHGESYEIYQKTSAKAKEVYEKKFQRDLGHLNIKLPEAALRKMDRYFRDLSIADKDEAAVVLAELEQFDASELKLHKNKQELEKLGKSVDELRDLQEKLVAVHDAEGKHPLLRRFFYGRKALEARKDLADQGIKIADVTRLMNKNKRALAKGELASGEIAKIMDEFEDMRRKILVDIADATGITKAIQTEVSDKLLEMMNPDVVQDEHGSVQSSATPDASWLKVMEEIDRLDDEPLPVDGITEASGMDYTKKIRFDRDEAYRTIETKVKADVAWAVGKLKMDRTKTWKDLDKDFGKLMKQVPERDRNLLRDAFADAVRAIPVPPEANRAKIFAINAWRGKNFK